MFDQSRSHPGILIKPGPRKSIHSYKSPLAIREDMGRFGLYDSASAPQDEVDNVLSKPQRIPSPESEKRGKVRRNSCSNSNYEFSDVSSDNRLLSKSLPAYLSSSYCSDDNSEEELTNKKNNNDRTRKSFSFHNESSHLSISSLSESQSTEEKTNWKYIAVIIMPIIIAIISYHWFPFTYNADSRKNNHKQFSDDIRFLGMKYDMNHNSTLQVQIGIASIFEKEDTGSFTFIYNSKSTHFKKHVFESFIHDIASTAAKYLRNNTNAHHVVLENKDLRMQSHPELINRYRDEVEKTGVMLVKELENVPANLAMAFHYYCDEYNPLVKKSAIFFTLDLAKCSNNYRNSTSHTAIENCLKNKWMDVVPKDNMGALLTRVVSVVVDIYSIF